MSPVTRRACGLAVGAALVAGGTAFAADNAFVLKHFKEPASRGLAVKKPLDELVAVSDARVVVPRSWKPKGTTQFDTGSSPCRYRVKFTVRSRIDDPGDAAAR